MLEVDRLKVLRVVALRMALEKFWEVSARKTPFKMTEEIRLEIEKVDIVIKVSNPGRLVPDMADYSRGRLKMYEGRVVRFEVGSASEGTSVDGSGVGERNAPNCRALAGGGGRAWSRRSGAGL